MDSGGLHRCSRPGGALEACCWRSQGWSLRSGALGYWQAPPVGAREKGTTNPEAPAAGRRRLLARAGAPLLQCAVMETTLRKATIADVPHIQRLINDYASAGEMLPRSLNELYENLRDFFVAEAGGSLVGCGACHITWEDLAEVKSVAVAPEWQRRGVGRQIVTACLEEARQLEIKRVFVLTYQQKFFESLGFVAVDKAELPHKIWTECINCPKFPDCGEIAMVHGC